MQIIVITLSLSTLKNSFGQLGERTRGDINGQDGASEKVTIELRPDDKEELTQ